MRHSRQEVAISESCSAGGLRRRVFVATALAIGAIAASCSGSDPADVSKLEPAEPSGEAGPRTRDASSADGERPLDEDAVAPATKFAASDWEPSALTQPFVAGARLKPLPGAMGGAPLWISNNPELIDSVGWLMQSGRTDAVRGGHAFPLAGKSVLYLFHINRIAAGAYMHLLVTNPQSSPVTVSGRGSLYTNRDKPALGPAQNQSYAVADDWIRGNLGKTFGPVTIPPGKAFSVATSRLLDANMIDGRFELDASAGIYAYTVVTSAQSVAEATDLSQGAPAAGLILRPGPNEFGRLAGVYGGSRWESSCVVEVPPVPAHLGVALNTNAKFATMGVFLQDQTAAPLMMLRDSGERSYGNYGDEYALHFKLVNSAAVSRTVSLSFATAASGASVGATWDGPVKVDAEVVPVYTTGAAPRQQLGTWTLAASEERDIEVRFFVPGLSVQGQQLILESK